MNISITPELEELINKKVKTGLYHSASEVVREGLRLLKEQDELKAFRLRELKKDIEDGLEEARSGRIAPLDTEAIKREGKKERPRRKTKDTHPKRIQ